MDARDFLPPGGFTEFLKALVFAVWLLGAVSCDSGHGNDNALPWQTGNAKLDSLMDLADALAYSYMYDDDHLKRVLDEADAVAASDSSLPIRSAAIYLRLFRESFSSDSLTPGYHQFNEEDLVSRSTHPYLRARLNLLQSQGETNLEKKTDILFGILPDFVDATDSMRVVETLYELNMAYGKVWDTETQIDYMHEILKYVPDSLPILRAIMQSNVVRLQRTRTDSVSYLNSLDSLRNEHNLMRLAPALGVIVFSDLYRLRGRKSDLDSASYYLNRLELRHDSERVYYVQLLYKLISEGDAVSAADIADKLASRISDEDTPLDMESMKALIEYYKYVGNKVEADSLSRRLASAQRSADAFERAIRLSRLNADRRIADFRKYNDDTRRRQHATSIWLTVGVILVLILPPGIIAFVRLRKSHRESDNRLKNDLDNTRRRLTVAEMRSAEKDRAFNDLLQEMDSLPVDPDARAEVIRKRLKVQLCGNDEWERFTAVFTEMRPGFVDNLKARYPQLTRGDVRLCCLLEMGLETKHIAQLLMIRPESVKKHRQRLRAKFGITPEVSWTEFFSHI